MNWLLAIGAAAPSRRQAIGLPVGSRSSKEELGRTS
jgi:hypothetical protein